MEYLYYTQWKENHVWKDIYINHIIPIFELKDKHSGLEILRDARGNICNWPSTKHQYCMNHYEFIAQYQCLKCSYVALCFKCAHDKSNVHHCHSKKALFLQVIPKPNPIKYSYCEMHYNKKARYLCLECRAFAFFCVECSNNPFNLHRYHKQVQFSHDLVIHNS